MLRQSRPDPPPRPGAPRLTALPAPGALQAVGRRALGAVSGWSARSQAGAIRNAMTASTTLLEARIQREEVEYYLASKDRHRAEAIAATEDYPAAR